MKRYICIHLLIMALAVRAHAEQVTYEIDWAVSGYPSSQGNYSGCGEVAIDGLPVVVSGGTFSATGTVVTSATFCPTEEPWGMYSYAALYFARTGTLAESAPRIYQGEWVGSFDITLEEPQLLQKGDTVLFCFMLRPATPDCVITGPYPTGTVHTATLTLELESQLPTNHRTWGAIKALYRLPANSPLLPTGREGER